MGQKTKKRKRAKHLSATVINGKGANLFKGSASQHLEGDLDSDPPALHVSSLPPSRPVCDSQSRQTSPGEL